LLPQALKRQCTPATAPLSSVTKVGPVSRIQLSLIGRGSTSTPTPQASETSAASAGLHTMVTGSNCAMVWATSA
jgi:hypothetical protein